MAQETYIYQNDPDRGESTASTQHSAPYCLETPYGFQLDLDFLKYVDDIERGDTIRRLGLQRRPRVANYVAPQGVGTDPVAHWTSSESLSPVSSNEARQPSLSSSSSSSSSSMNRRRPPLPPSHPTPAPSARGNGAPPALSSPSLRPLEGKPPPAAARSHTLPPRPNPLVEKTLTETRRRLEQEQASSSCLPIAPEPHPRRRLGSFGGLGSSGSLSPYTGWSALNQTHAKGAKLSVPDQAALGGSSLGGVVSSGGGGSLRISPLSSGRATPVAGGVSPLQLQLVREQMVLALQRLKELEEQVKAIPVLQVKISVLQEEKRQLAAQVKGQRGGAGEPGGETFRKRAHSTGSAEQQQRSSRAGEDSQGRRESRDEAEGQARSGAPSGLEEFRQLNAEMQALERKIQDARLETRHGSSMAMVTLRASQARGRRSVAVGDDKNMDEVVVQCGSPMATKPSRDVAVETRPETRSAGVGVSETMLGVASETEVELESQQRTIRVLSDRVRSLEAELEGAALRAEMGRLRDELREAGSRNRADKGSSARPEMQSTATHTGDHTHLAHATAERVVQGVAVGVSCRPETRGLAAGPDVPMDQLEVRDHPETRDQGVGSVRVETRDQGVGSVCVETRDQGVGSVRVETRDQGVGSACVEMRCQGVGTAGRSVCEAGVLTEETMETLPQATGRPVSRGTLTDTVRGVDLGVMAMPCTASRRTNTAVGALVSRFTNTAAAFATESATNTAASPTQDRHTNTSPTLTRSVAVGNGKVRDVEAAVKTRSVAVGTATPRRLPVSTATTRDAGIGLVNVTENFLVGLKTRNIASGPSRLPDPAITRSIGVGVGDGRIRDAAGRMQTLRLCPQTQPPAQTLQPSPQSRESAHAEPGLDHYIERMQRLLTEQQGLLTESHSQLGDVITQPHTHLSSINTQLESTLSCLNSAMRLGGPEELQPKPGGTDLRSPSKGSEVRKKSLMGNQILHGQASEVNSLRSIMKRKDGRKGSDRSGKSLKFVGVSPGVQSMSTSDDSTEASDSEEDEEEEEEERRRRRRRRKKEEVEKAPGLSERSRAWSNPNQPVRRERYDLSEKMLSACHTLKAHLSNSKPLSSCELRSYQNTVQQDWFRVSSQKGAEPGMVADFLSAFRGVSVDVLIHVANMADRNGNTALHYSVSHSNFSVVKTLLDADVCNVDQQNKAGYTPIMLAALATVETQDDMRVVEELFTRGDVNAKASQAGQTALMLAVSHGRMDMVRALLASGSEVNLQDDEGSTALMCASEHGHADIVKLLLAQLGCDATLSDSDESTALSIALEAGHRDIAMLLYAHVNFSKGQTGGTPRNKMSPTPTGRGIYD